MATRKPTAKRKKKRTRRCAPKRRSVIEMAAKPDDLLTTVLAGVAELITNDATGFVVEQPDGADFAWRITIEKQKTVEA